MPLCPFDKSQGRARIKKRVAIFTGRFSSAVGTTREASKVQAVCHSRPAQRICALIVPDMGTYSARRLVISPSSGHSRAAAYNIPYRIALLDAQGGAVSPVSPEKQPPQIEHLAADNREQFGVRTGLTGKALPGGENPDIRSGHGYPLPDLRPARRKLSKGVPHETLCRLGVAGTPRPAAAGR